MRKKTFENYRYVEVEVSKEGIIDVSERWPFKRHNGNFNRFSYYIARILGIDEENGEEIREYLKHVKSFQYSVKDFKKGDILCFSLFDHSKKEGAKKCVIVGDYRKKEGILELVVEIEGEEVNTFRRAFKALYGETYIKGNRTDQPRKYKQPKPKPKKRTKKPKATATKRTTKVTKPTPPKMVMSGEELFRTLISNNDSGENGFNINTEHYISKSGHIVNFWFHEWPTCYLGYKYNDIATYKVTGMDEEGNEILKEVAIGYEADNARVFNDGDIVKVVARNDKEEAVRYFLFLRIDADEREFCILDRFKGKMIRDFATLREAI